MNVFNPAAAATSITCRFVDPTSVATHGCEKINRATDRAPQGPFCRGRVSIEPDDGGAGPGTPGRECDRAADQAKTDDTYL